MRGFLRWLGVALATVGLAMLVVAWHAAGTLRLAPLIGDGMVLQRDASVSLSGHARPGWPVIVTGTWGGATFTRADASGEWRAHLGTGAAGGPYRVLVWAGEAATIRDVWIGETWLCAGQSNMTVPVGEDDPMGAVTLPSGPPIRLFAVELAAAQTPQATCRGVWRAASLDDVRAFSATCWHFGDALHAVLDVPIGLVAASAPGTDIEGWTSEEAIGGFPEVAARIARAEHIEGQPPWRPGLFFNSMIAPLTGYTFRGVVWYQGEANVPRAAEYARLFPAMILDWRRRFGRELPFEFVQLPGFDGYRPSGAISALRDAQRRALALPATAMVVTIDLGDGKDIHGARKTVVGTRLAASALADVYGRSDIVAWGPLYRGMEAGEYSVRLRFDHAEGGLVAASTPLRGFEAAGEDGRFRPAWAEIDGETVVLRTPRISKPVAVRYAWEDVPVPTLRNAGGLPASPFRTDDWAASAAGPPIPTVRLDSP